MEFQKIVLLCCILFACNHAVNEHQDMMALYQHWVHSFEEDDAERHYLTFRPAAYPFPPARGRDGFELKKNGKAVAYPIAPADGNMVLDGKWSLKNEQLSITVKSETTTYQLIELTKEKLVLKVLK